MENRDKFIGDILIEIANNLDISETMSEKAISSYNAVGKWIGAGEFSNDVRILPQGSFALGTVIRPITDKEEYDIDLACILNDGQMLDNSSLKNLVGDRLKENELYKKMLKEEGKRCWTMEYDEFHMDILPSAPRYKEYNPPVFSEIRLTHKEDSGFYTERYSNPYLYKEWFENQMRKVLNRSIEAYASEKSLTIDDVPTYKVRTPLQRSIQLLKRHRDIYYREKPEVRKKSAPISIIITTLAAHAYANQDNIYDALKCILDNMENYIEIRYGEHWIKNPVLPDENFADKWNTDPTKKQEFAVWLEQAKRDILLPNNNIEGIHSLSMIFENCFGKNIVQKTMESHGEKIRKMRSDGDLMVSTLNPSGIGSGENKNKETKIKDHTFFGK